MTFWTNLKNHQIAVPTFGTTFGKIWATFHSNLWLHHWAMFLTYLQEAWHFMKQSIDYSHFLLNFFGTTAILQYSYKLYPTCQSVSYQKIVCTVLIKLLSNFDIPKFFILNIPACESIIFGLFKHQYKNYFKKINHPVLGFKLSTSCTRVSSITTRLGRLPKGSFRPDTAVYGFWSRLCQCRDMNFFSLRQWNCLSHAVASKAASVNGPLES